MLNESPDVYVCPPMPVYDILFPHLDAYGDLSINTNWRELAMDLARLLRVNHQPLPFAPDFNALLQRAEGSGRSLGALVGAAIDLIAEHEGAQVAGYKFSINFSLLDRFASDVPVTHVIYMIRDPRDVVISKIKAGFETKPPVELAQDWADSQREALRRLENWEGVKIIRLRYEDVLAAPTAKVQELHRWLGATPADPQSFHERMSNVHAANRSHMWHNLSRPIMRENYGKFYKEWNIGAVREVEGVCADVMERFDYQKADPSQFESETRAPTSRNLTEADKDFYREQDALIHELITKAETRRSFLGSRSDGQGVRVSDAEAASPSETGRNKQRSAWFDRLINRFWRDR